VCAHVQVLVSFVHMHMVMRFSFKGTCNWKHMIRCTLQLGVGVKRFYGNFKERNFISIPNL